MSAYRLREKLLESGISVKICGVTDREEAREIITLGADLLGLNFFPESKRFLGSAIDHPWIRELPVCRVGVFVNAPSRDILKLRDEGWIDVAQLHGDEGPEECRELKSEGLPTIKAVGLGDAEGIEGLSDFDADAVLLDAPAGAERGGTGQTIDWELARSAVAAHPDLPVILAGGLTPQNVGEAARIVRPACVDVASGVEASPGRKDLELVRDFISSARGS